jgi:hypothetical protein
LGTNLLFDEGIGDLALMELRLVELGPFFLLPPQFMALLGLHLLPSHAGFDELWQALLVSSFASISVARAPVPLPDRSPLAQCLKRMSCPAISTTSHFRSRMRQRSRLS